MVRPSEWVGPGPALFDFGSMGMEITDRVEDIIAPVLGDMGYDIVRVRLSGGSRPNLQIMAERRDQMPMTVDDCAEISRMVSAMLDVEDPISDKYVLEVSSPGIDRPLVRPGDFERFAGFEAKVELRRAIDGRRRFRGRLVGIDDGVVRLETADGEATLPFEEIGTAKLVITDDMLAAIESAAATNEGQA